MQTEVEETSKMLYILSDIGRLIKCDQLNLNLQESQHFSP